MRTRPLRIAWLGHGSSELGGGMATYSQEVVAGLRSRGHHVAFFHHGFKAETSVSPVADEAFALDSVQLMKPLVFSRPRAKRQLVDRLRDQEFDLVHASFWFSSLDFDLPKTCHALGIPVVATFHIAFDTRISVWGGLTSAAYRLYVPTLSDCDRVIVFGEAQRDTLIEMGVPQEVLRILPNGVDIERYKPGESDWKQRLGASRLFVFLGRVDSEKNVDTLIRAFLACRPSEDSKLVIVGTGTERRRLQRQHKDPRLIFTGHIADAEQRIGILQAADAFILPSSVEGLSLSMLEAMACGAATVATDVGGDGEALRGAGIVIDPGKLEEQLELAIREILELPWLSDSLGRAARERVVERYSLERNIDRLLEVYTGVLR